ncbi:CPBP family intramembrane metalloprotease [Roseovarius sp. PS-C2]|uniref:CPBP family intramembrane glutamic endopeptidase n=1 Tax=Roseovarius sp. PS-C2 TaxID=2820814 RepID=UPI001C0C7CCB|nr:CPBP family intramembrane glutamic endopeptidase [Roseovarius sp. PS-C2]MBU3260148.1 CPBP family intramembrane metalloprotease [Roseovarius sp. PS-C2]
MRYDPHETLVAPARPSAQPLRLLAGIVLTVILFLVLSSGVSALHRAFLSPQAWEALAQNLQTGSSPAAVLINLFVFGLLIVALAVSMTVVHQRRIGGLIGPLAPALRQFRQVSLVLFALLIVINILPGDDSLAAEPNMPFGLWLLFLPVGLLALLVQTAAEEMAFRGYLQSQLAARFAHPIVWMGLPSILFALLHLDPALHGENTWFVIAWAGCFGLAAADLTARSGTLGPAIALHFVNNMNAILFAAPKGNFDGLALYVYPFSLDELGGVWAWFPTDLMLLGCSWLAARVALRR